MIKLLKNSFFFVVATCAIFVVVGCATTSGAAAAEEPTMGPKDMAGVMELTPVEATASSYQEAKGLVPAFAIDGDMNTTWTAEGSQWIVIDLGEVKNVVCVDVAMLKGSERRYKMMFEGSADGATYMPISGNVTSSGRSEDMETFDTDDMELRYLRINVNGASSSQWNNIKEVKIYGM